MNLWQKHQAFRKRCIFIHKFSYFKVMWPQDLPEILVDDYKLKSPLLLEYFVNLVQHWDTNTLIILWKILYQHLDAPLNLHNYNDTCWYSYFWTYIGWKERCKKIKYLPFPSLLIGSAVLSSCKNWITIRLTTTRESSASLYFSWF